MIRYSEKRDDGDIAINFASMTEHAKRKHRKMQ